MHQERRDSEAMSDDGSSSSSVTSSSGSGSSDNNNTNNMEKTTTTTATTTTGLAAQALENAVVSTGTSRALLATNTVTGPSSSIMGVNVVGGGLMEQQQQQQHVTTTTTTTTSTRDMEASGMTSLLAAAMAGGQTSGMTTTNVYQSTTPSSSYPASTGQYQYGQVTTTVMDTRDLPQREEKRKISSTIVSEQYIGELPRGEEVKYVEVPVYQEVVKHVTKKEVVEIEKRVPKYEYEYVEKIVEVPQVHLVDKQVEVPQIQEVIRHVPKLQIVDVPKEVLRHVPKIETQIVEKVVEVPGPTVEVPKPYTVENKIPVTTLVDTDVPVVVAQSVHPIIAESDDVIEVDVTDFEPNVIPVDVHVVKPVATTIHQGGRTERHKLCSIPHAQYNSLLKTLNPHLAASRAEESLLPYVRDEAGLIQFLQTEATFAPLQEGVTVEGMPKLRRKHREGRIVGTVATAEELNRREVYTTPQVQMPPPRISQGPTSVTNNTAAAIAAANAAGKLTSTSQIQSRSMPSTPGASYTQAPTISSYQQSPAMHSNMVTTQQTVVPSSLRGATTQSYMPTSMQGSSTVLEAGVATSQLPVTAAMAQDLPPSSLRPPMSTTTVMQQQALPKGVTTGASSVYTAGNTAGVSSYAMPITGVESSELPPVYPQGQMYLHGYRGESTYTSSTQHYLGDNRAVVAERGAMVTGSIPEHSVSALDAKSSYTSSEVVEMVSDMGGRRGCCGCGGTGAKKELYVVRTDSSRGPTASISGYGGSNRLSGPRSDVVSAHHQVCETEYVVSTSGDARKSAQSTSRGHKSSKSGGGEFSSSKSRTGTSHQQNLTVKYDDLSIPVTSGTEHVKLKKCMC